MLVDTSLRALLDAFASPAPTPGGGSASALASAVGASLLMMVASLPRTRSGSDEDRVALAAAAGALAAARQQLLQAIDLDAAAYDRVVAAYKLSKATADEQAARTEAIQRALTAATEAPLDVMRASAAALREAAAVAAHGHRAAVSDVGVATALLDAGLHGARLNVAANVTGLKDRGYAAGVEQEAERLAGDGGRAAQAARAALGRAAGEV